MVFSKVRMLQAGSICVDVLFSDVFVSYYVLSPTLLVVEYLSVKILFVDLFIVMWKIQFVFNGGGYCPSEYITFFPV